MNNMTQQHIRSADGVRQTLPPLPRAGIDVFLQPGELYFGDSNTRIRTLLGSCVALTIWSEKHQAGGMCHCLLPRRSQYYTQDNLDARYIEDAAIMFMAEANRIGTSIQDYQVKMFGGGNMFPNAGLQDERQIGWINLRFTRQLLASLGVKLHAEHCGGTGHRSLILDLWNGETWLKHQMLALESVA